MVIEDKGKQQHKAEELAILADKYYARTRF